MLIIHSLHVLGVILIAKTLKVAMEICFDLMYEHYSRIGYESVDLMIHPSNLWQSFADMFVQDIAFRSIENGYNTLHCASGGNDTVHSSFVYLLYINIF